VPFRDTARRRYIVLIVVAFAHAGLIAAMLLARPLPSREVRNPIDYLSLLMLPHDPAKIDTGKIAVKINPVVSSPRLNTELSPMPNQIGSNAITLSAAEQKQHDIDWDRESDLAVESSIAQVAKENSYRDMSKLTPEQLEWVKKNHMEPMPGFQWDRNSRGELLRHGIVKLNDYCVLVVVIPFCRFGGTIQYNGDLFKDMHDPKLPD
jgi:hypothetical protein